MYIHTIRNRDVCSCQHCFGVTLDEFWCASVRVRVRMLVRLHVRMRVRVHMRMRVRVCVCAHARAHTLI